jgi:hypothetical protein
VRIGLAGALLVACYSPHADPGAPCSPNLACPSGQSCDTSQSPPLCEPIGTVGGTLDGPRGGDSSGGGRDGPSPPPDASPAAYTAGSLIIPMGDGFQDSGQLRAFGLVAALLRGGVGVDWIVRPGKLAGSNDLELDGGVSVSDLESGNPLPAPVTYSSAPFVIPASERTAALPIVNAWLGSDTVTFVHDVTAGGFDAPVGRHLTRAPAIALLGDAQDTVAFTYLNAAGIPDSTGATWTASSPDVLTETAVAGATSTDHGDGALNANGSPYCAFASMHYGSDTSTPEIAAELETWLATQAHGAVLECLSVQTIENAADLVTTAGVVANTGTTGVAASLVVTDDLHAQFDGSFTASSGALVSFTLAAGSTFAPDVHVLMQLTASSSDVVLATGLSGRLSLFGGHQYTTTMPMSTNASSRGARVFLDALFASACNP